MDYSYEKEAVALEQMEGRKYMENQRAESSRGEGEREKEVETLEGSTLLRLNMEGGARSHGIHSGSRNSKSRKQTLP